MDLKDVKKYIVLIVATITVVLIVITGIIMGFKLANKRQNEALNNTNNDNSLDVYENKVENKITSDTSTKVKELIFDSKYLQSGKVKGDTKILEDRIENVSILSITGVADNEIEQINMVDTKNRWYKTIDLTEYNTLEFYARKGADNGDMMICIDNSIIKKVRFNDFPTTWTKYTVDLSEFKGEHILAFAGGYSDKTGSKDSNTQYRNIKLK